MEPAEIEPARRGFARHLLSWVSAFRWGIFLVIFVALFYVEENWRGKRAWERYKREQKSKGRILDIGSRPRITVPDEDNFFQAPGMANLFLTTASSAQGRMVVPAGIPEFRLNRLLKVVVEIVPFRTHEPEPANADLVLEYDPPMMRFCRLPRERVVHPPEAVIPLIVMDDVPLMDAIRNLARQAGANYMLDPRIGYGIPDANGNPQPQPMVSLRWEEVTAMQALRALLANYNLLWLEDPGTGIGRIVHQDPGQPPVLLDDGVRERLEELVRVSFGPILQVPQGLSIFSRAIEDARPVRLAIRTHVPFSDRELRFLIFPQQHVYGEPLLRGCTIKETPGHCFFVQIPPNTACVAADYLDWSARYEYVFEQMREALKRPYALPPESPTNDSSRSEVNLASMREMSQALAQRAQCQLLLGQPDKALEELTLLRDLCRILNGPPADKPTTLTTAMYELMFAELHAGVVADGLHLHAWQEPQLAPLQAQLEEVDLQSTLVRALAQHPAFACSSLEKSLATQGSQTRLCGWPTQTLGDRLKNPRYLVLDFGPRGWIYQNLVNLDGLLQSLNGALDHSGLFIVPHNVEMAHNRVQAIVERFSPGTLVAWFTVPNTLHAHQAMAFTQTTINQVALACALERYNLVRARYPDSLEALVPGFVSVLPMDVINGRPLQYCRIPDRGYQLHSVGWDEQDDKGIPAATSAWRDYFAKGDWTWRFPVN